MTEKASEELEAIHNPWINSLNRWISRINSIILSRHSIRLLTGKSSWSRVNEAAEQLERSKA